jgi:hypothetical protein
MKDDGEKKELVTAAGHFSQTRFWTLKHTQAQFKLQPGLVACFVRLCIEHQQVVGHAPSSVTRCGAISSNGQLITAVFSPFIWRNSSSATQSRRSEMCVQTEHRPWHAVCRQTSFPILLGVHEQKYIWDTSLSFLIYSSANLTTPQLNFSEKYRSLNICKRKETNCWREVCKREKYLCSAIVYGLQQSVRRMATASDHPYVRARLCREEERKVYVE